MKLQITINGHWPKEGSKKLVALMLYQNLQYKAEITSALYWRFYLMQDRWKTHAVSSLSGSALCRDALGKVHAHNKVTGGKWTVCAVNSAYGQPVDLLPSLTCFGIVRTTSLGVNRIPHKEQF